MARTADTSGLAEHRGNNFDILRLFGAALVLYGHSFALVGASGPGFAGDGVQTIGVKIFFVVSGYLIIRSWLRDPNPWRYFVRRALRIWPAFLAVIALTMLVLGPLYTTLPLAEYFSSRTLWGYGRNAFFYITYSLPGVFAGNTYPGAVNGSFWTLPVELSMYVLVPGALALFGLFGRLRLPLLVATTLGLAAWDLIATHRGPLPDPVIIYASNFWFWLQLAPYFLAGSCVALGRWERYLDVYLGMLLLLFAGMAGRGQLGTEFLLMIGLPYAVLAFGLGDSRLLGRVTASGDYSYGLFLWGFVVQQALVATLGTPGGALGNFVMSFVVAMALAILSWHALEKRALALKPYRSRMRDAAPV